MTAIAPEARQQLRDQAASVVGDPIDRSPSIENFVDTAGEARDLPICIEIERALRSYAIDRQRTGDFLNAVLSNDLTQAALRADARNQFLLSAIMLYCANRLPANSWGDPEKVRRWLAWEEE